MSDFIKKIKIYKRIYQHMGNYWKSAELHSQGQLGMGHRETLCEGFFVLFLTRSNSTSRNHVYDPFHKPLSHLLVLDTERDFGKEVTKEEA